MYHSKITEAQGAGTSVKPLRSRRTNARRNFSLTYPTAAEGHFT
ncbi:rCG48230 [Rattus norvegicus]|uniref:RCG48230 n=1 Tax=Rattus norvegicus TaxID=10116 RepID=A6HZC9_RAT|nr:rCG48230 [Rattus norvegicus]